jgi:hypothetical protein
MIGDADCECGGGDAGPGTRGDRGDDGADPGVASVAPRSAGRPYAYAATVRSRRWTSSVQTVLGRLPGDSETGTAGTRAD